MNALIPTGHETGAIPAITPHLEAGKIAPALSNAPMMSPEQFATSRVNNISGFFGNILKPFGGLVPAFLTIAALALMWQGMKMIITGKKPEILGKN